MNFYIILPHASARVEDNILTSADATVISATHRDIVKEVAEVRFREDLYDTGGDTMPDDWETEYFGDNGVRPTLLTTWSAGGLPFTFENNTVTH